MVSGLVSGDQGRKHVKAIALMCSKLGAPEFFDFREGRLIV